MLFKIQMQNFAEFRKVSSSLLRVGGACPDGRVRRLLVRAGAVQVRQVDQARRLYALLFDPLEHWTEVGSATTRRLEHDRIAGQELFRAMYFRVAEHEVRGLGVGLFDDRGNLSGALLQRPAADGTAGVHRDYDWRHLLASQPWQVQPERSV